MATDPDALRPAQNGHSSFGLIVEINPEGSVQILVMDCTEPSNVGRKDLVGKLILPGGTGQEGESREGTLLREVSAETSDKGKPLNFRKVTLFFKKILPGDTDKGGGTHTQYFFAVDVVEKSFRREKKIEADGAILGAPRWMEISVFINDSITKKRHMKAVVVFLHLLAKTQKKVAGRYASLLRGTESLFRQEYQP